MWPLFYSKDHLHIVPPMLWFFGWRDWPLYYSVFYSRVILELEVLALSQNFFAKSTSSFAKLKDLNYYGRWGSLRVEIAISFLA